MLYSSLEVEDGEAYMRGIASRVFNGKLKPNEAQDRLLSTSFRENWRGELKIHLL
jgi:hypothetical protein